MINKQMKTPAWWWIGFIIGTAFWVVVIYVAFHFIAKWW